MEHVSEYETELAKHLKLEATIRAAVPQIDRGVLQPDILRPWLEEYMTAEETLRGGRLVTDLYRFGQRIWPAAARILKGGVDTDTETLRVDARGPYGLTVVVRNTSTQSVLVQTHARRIVRTRSDLGAPLRWEDRPVREPLSPGETMELSLHYAICALREGTWRIFEPALWETSGAIPQRETLVEVGYALVNLGVDSRGRASPPTERRKAS